MVKPRATRGRLQAIRVVFLLFVVQVVLVSGCESLRVGKPIYPIKEYERMIAGRLDAQYIGTENCLAACHFHDKSRDHLEASTHGVQISKKAGLSLVNCETCHGPGSLAVVGLTSERVAADEKAGIRTKCNNDTLIKIKELPAQARSLICIKCHSANSTFSLHDWNAGMHNMNEVGCPDCHNLHAGPDQRVEPETITRTCQKCHADIVAQFSFTSRHPLNEKRVFCTDCHEPHGNSNDKMLRAASEKATCTKCHAEKEGPFLYEHGGIMERCSACHSPHGSVYNNLLTSNEPFLCLQCHAAHRTTKTTSLESRAAFSTRCTDCHSQIHGTDLPSARGGRFIH